MNERIKAIVRLVVILILALNGLLAGIGVSPISNETAYGFVSDLVTILASVWAWWWKNNNVTKAAAHSQEVLVEFKKMTPEAYAELTNGLEEGEDPNDLQ